MEYVYGALLLHRLGKKVNEENLKSVVAAAGVEVDESKIKSLVASLRGIDIAKELESASLIAAAPVGAGGEAGASAEKKEKPEEKKKEAAAEGLSALFG